MHRQYDRNGDYQYQTEYKNSSLRKILYFDQTSWLPENLLERGDRMTMGASIEGRMPFMDVELARFVSTLPDHYRIRGRTSKWILRSVMHTLLPDSILNRPKVGFRVPVNVWFQTSLKDYLYDHLTGEDSRTKCFYDAKQLNNLLDQHVKGKANHEKVLWTLLSLELWHRAYL
jgi:asparagine synthase (glutamine-hydrolysing)